MPQTLLNNRYLLEHKIGEGGMARVYRGRDTRLNRRVAIKVLHGHYVDEPGFLDRFQHEAQAAANLSHPNVVDVYDVGQDGDIHYIVMEFVEGRDLKMVINREAPLGIDRAVAIAEAVALGLEAAHRVGLVHRDIKPQNIMVSPDGQVRITDFGIAKSHLSTATTEAGVTFGTADYLAPEQARGQPATPRSDIYSLGIVLYEMLTGKLPFVGDHAIGVAMQHVSATPVPPSQINPVVPPQLEGLVLRLLSKDPAQRPQSAHECARLLHNYRTLTSQETSYGNVRPAPEATPSRNPAPRVNNTPSTRITIPPPNAARPRAPDERGVGCGGFIIGFLLLVGVVSIIVLFSSGTLDFLLPANANSNRTPTAAIATTSTSAAVQLTATVPPTATPSPTAVPLVAVPDLRGKTGTEAQELLLASRFIPIVGGQFNDELIPLGSVISQTIQPGTQIAAGQPVTYTLSRGPSIVLIDMPNFVQAPLDFARSQSAALGLQIQVVEQSSQTIDEGYIISQAPRNGARVPPGTTVQVIVSRGDKIQIPKLKGLTEQQAKDLLAATKGAINYSYSDPQGRDKLGDLYDQVAPGTVVSSDPPEETWVPRGSYVTLGIRGG